MKKIFILIAILLIFFEKKSLRAENISIHKLEIQKLISKIPHDDLQEIKDLFEYLFKFSELSFTLYGDKPTSFCSIIHLKPIFPKNLISHVNILFCPDKIYQKQWMAWQKHKHLFQINKFIFLEGTLGVLLINKFELTKSIQNNREKFTEILGRDFDVQMLLTNITHKKDLFALLGNNHELLGILLGFGSHNSKLFQRKEDLLNSKNNLFPSSWYASEAQELVCLQELLEPFNSVDQFFPLVNENRVMCLVDPTHTETKILREKYELQRKQINEKHAKEDWFEQILIQLTSE